MGARYKNYNSRLNAKGFTKRTADEANPSVTSERGKRRRERENKVHAHEWVNLTPSANTSYDAVRIANEQRFYCKRHNKGRPNGGGGGAKFGGGQRTGCGETCRSPK